MATITRRNFIKMTSMSALALAATGMPISNEKVFAAENLSVKTRYGTFNGFIDKNGVKTWLGIPFAQPPVGKLRWQAPQPLKPSNKTFDAKKFGLRAMQIDDGEEGSSTIPQSEDCLTLNIWKKSDKKNLPVMVWIHGGAFSFESTSDKIYYGSNFAAANDVILVTVEYRLNIFGFMNFASIDSSFEDSGYLGIKDQIAALSWIKENISEFGGNPENITIFGESAGSTSIMLLLVAPDAKNLFQKAIPQSGSIFLYNTPELSVKIAEEFLEMNGAKNMRDMMKKSTDELRNAYIQFTNARGRRLNDYIPTCDGKFLPLEPGKALKNGAARGIKMLTGTTADEWRYFLMMADNLFEILRNEPKKHSPLLARYKKHTPQEIYRAWLNGRPDTMENYEAFVNQVDWRVGQELAAEYQSAYEDVYYYLFSQPSPNEKLRSCHALDLPYTFNTSDKDLESNPNQNLVRAIQASWAAFAATGNP
ncbi:MAG: carboxylesterase family protein, partial [Selenomonadaceae bacterium]|nr:carboxylesterase family protein [Selenomonadaceae bacterium]